MRRLVFAAIFGLASCLVRGADTTRVFSSPGAYGFIPRHDGIYLLEVSNPTGADVSVEAKGCVQYAGDGSVTLGFWLKSGETVSVSSQGSASFAFSDEAEVSGEPVSLNAIYAEALAGDPAKVFPVSAAGSVTMLSGVAYTDGNASIDWTSSGGEPAYYFTDRFDVDSIGCLGCNYVSSSGSNHPWCLVSTNFTYSAVDTNYLNVPLMPGEILLHPSGDGGYIEQYLRITAPSDGVYRVVGIFRDLYDGGAAMTDGVTASVRIRRAGDACTCSIAEKDVCAETGNRAKVLVIRNLKLKAGAPVAFFIDRNTICDGDSTGLFAYLFPESDVPGDELLNIDIDGHNGMGSDPTTYSGAGAIPCEGTFWNGIYGVGHNHGAVPTDYCIGAENLVAADGETVTGVSVSITNLSSTINFDGNANGGYYALLSDYIFSYAGDGVNRVTIGSLLPNTPYDIVLYIDSRWWYMAYFNVDGRLVRSIHDGGGVFHTDGNNDYVMRCGVMSDAEGKIVFDMLDQSNPCIFSGFQIRGKFFAEKPGLVIIAR